MHDSILLAYAKAMLAAQKLESSLKMLFSLHNIMSGISKAQAPLTDEEFEELLSFPSKDKWPKNKQPIDKLTMGGAKDKLLQILPDLGLSPFPENAIQGLRATIQARNFVAHHYFLARAVLTKDPDALPALIAELEYYVELFNAWLPSLDRWIEMLMKAMGYTDDDLKELQNIVDEGPSADLRQDLLTDLKNQLAQIGVTVPQKRKDQTPMPTEDLIFDETLFSDEGLTEKGLMALRAFVAGGYVQGRIENDDLLLYTVFDHPNGVGEDIELGRINLYHVAGYSAQDLDDDQFNALAALFRNIATLIEGEAIVDRYPSAEGFSWTTTSPQIFPQDDDEQEQADAEE